MTCYSHKIVRPAGLVLIAASILTLSVAFTRFTANAAIPVATCGTLINAPGDYELTGNIGPCPQDGVVIAAAGVNFNLNGFTISGVSSPNSCDTNSP